MLVLSRKAGERLVVPRLQVAVTVLAIKGKAVRLGISAPADLAVYREEVWAQLNQQPSARKAKSTRENGSCTMKGKGK
jgi:carbon storage regulator